MMRAADALDLRDPGEGLDVGMGERRASGKRIETRAAIRLVNMAIRPEHEPGYVDGLDLVGDIIEIVVDRPGRALPPSGMQVFIAIQMQQELESILSCETHGARHQFHLGFFRHPNNRASIGMSGEMDRWIGLIVVDQKMVKSRPAMEFCPFFHVVLVPHIGRQ